MPVNPLEQYGPVAPGPNRRGGPFPNARQVLADRVRANVRRSQSTRAAKRVRANVAQSRAVRAARQRTPPGGKAPLPVWGGFQAPASTRPVLDLGRVGTGARLPAWQGARQGSDAAQKVAKASRKPSRLFTRKNLLIAGAVVAAGGGINALSKRSGSPTGSGTGNPRGIYGY